MTKIKLKNIDKIYDNGFQAVYNFNLEINQGEFIVFVGPSGCGKSTMMRMIAGLEDITKGELCYDDKCVNELSPKSRGIAMVFQSYALYPHLTVAENLGFGLSLEGFDYDYIDKRVAHTVKILGMGHLLERRPRELSGGQCQRVAVGRAIIRNPKIFLMDEPLSNLDAKQRVTMRSEIIQIHKKTKATTIYVTHDQVEAMTMADRIVVMRDGVVQQVGTPKELYYNPFNKFVASFLGEPPMNFVDCTIIGRRLNFKDVDSAVELPLEYNEFLDKWDNQQVVLGFRPESVVYDDNILNSSKASDNALSDNIVKDTIELQIDVDVIELLGDSQNVFGFIGLQPVILKAEPDMCFLEDKKTKINIRQSDIYLFDKNGTRLINQVNL